MSNTEVISKIPSIINVSEIPLGKDILDKLDEKGKASALRNKENLCIYKITYRSSGHAVVGYILEPRTGSQLPCIIWNRGGSNEFGAIQEEHLFSYQIARLALNGYIVIATQYSGNGGSEGKDEHGGGDLEDVLQLYKILRKYKRADVTRIGMIGASRGGMMTYMILARVKWLRAAVTIAGTANLVNKKKFRPEMETVYKRMFGGSLAEKKRRSAIFWPEKFPKKTPVLIMHGTADWRVDPMDSLVLAEKLYEYKVPHRLIMFEGGDHGLSEFRKEAEASALAWFERYVKNNEPLPNLKPHGK